MPIRIHASCGMWEQHRQCQVLRHIMQHRTFICRQASHVRHTQTVIAIRKCLNSLLCEQCSGQAFCQAILLLTPLCWLCIQYIQQKLQICSFCSFQLFRHLSLQKAIRSGGVVCHSICHIIQP